MAPTVDFMFSATSIIFMISDLLKYNQQQQQRLNKIDYCRSKLHLHRHIQKLSIATMPQLELSSN
jgi:phosphopantetheinyl transferase